MKQVQSVLWTRAEESKCTGVICTFPSVEARGQDAERNREASSKRCGTYP